MLSNLLTYFTSFFTSFTCRTALIIVDPQNDFCPGGSLAVNEANLIMPIINNLRDYLTTKYNTIVCITQDWHPKDHVSFHENNPGSTMFQPHTLENGIEQMMWPVHCVQDSDGAKFHNELITKNSDQIFQKGCKLSVDSYSGFGSPDLIEENTKLLGYLYRIWINRVVIVGLATDYCVKATALHAVKYKYKTYVVLNACRGVDIKTTQIAIEEMRNAGVIIVQDQSELFN